MKIYTILFVASLTPAAIFSGDLVRNVSLDSPSLDERLAARAVLEMAIPEVLEMAIPEVLEVARTAFKSNPKHICKHPRAMIEELISSLGYDKTYSLEWNLKHNPTIINSFALVDMRAAVAK